MTAVEPDADKPGPGGRLLAWLREPVTADLRTALIVALFCSVVLFAAAVVTWYLRLIIAAAALLVPFAAWYAHLAKAEATALAHERALELSKNRAGPRTHPGARPRAGLDEGGTVPAPLWAPGGAGYGDGAA